MARWTLIICTFLFVVVCIESKSSTSKNHELLSKLGLNRVTVPSGGHHRKRLAVESRHHGRSDDSHMFIIKLPPNPHYYVHNKPTQNHVAEASQKIPIGFKSNGKPGRIYHWNIPILKKIASAKNRSRLSDSNIIEIAQPKNWNDVVDKHVTDPETTKIKKPSYYIPARPKKSSFHKYFPGNGKPHSFYIIEKSKKPHYHRLLP